MSSSHRVEEVAVSADGDWLTPLVNTWNEVASYIPDSVKTSVASALPPAAASHVSGEAGAANEAASSNGGRSKDLVLAVCFDVRTREVAEFGDFSADMVVSGDPVAGQCAAALVLDRVLRFWLSGALV
jgi:hypothetical protein